MLHEKVLKYKSAGSSSFKSLCIWSMQMVTSAGKAHVLELPANEIFLLQDWSLTRNGGNNFSNL